LGGTVRGEKGVASRSGGFPEKKKKKNKTSAYAPLLVEARSERHPKRQEESKGPTYKGSRS